MFSNLTIKMKLIILGIIISLGFVFILITQRSAIGKINELATMEAQIKELNIKVLDLRKNEKDFLSRKNLKYVENFKKTVDEIKVLLNTLKEESKHFDLKQSNINNYQEIVTKYERIFYTIVQTQQKIGLNPKDGLYGELRSEVHKVQNFAKKANDYYLLSSVYDLRKQEKDFMLRLDKKYLSKFDKINNRLLNDNNYLAMHPLLKNYKEKFFALVKLEERKGFKQNLGLLGELRDIIHQSNEELENLTSLVLETLKIENNKVSIFTMISTFVIAGIIIIILILLSRYLTTTISSFKDGLIGFFAFLNHEKEDVELLNDKKNDEIGNMAKVINQNILKVKDNTLKDKALIDDATNVANEIKEGYLNKKITLSSNSKELNELKNVINDMLTNLSSNINEIQNVLSSFANYNYTKKVREDDIEGEILELCKNVNVVGNTINKMLSDSKSIGLGLQGSANILVNNVQTLTTNANTTAASLEETAAAIEEITSTVIRNNQNIEEMSQYSKNVISAVETGENLANQTTVSMDEINEQVLSINDAITVIDQIAFQTNILSLNAAVEAATAGESGKGFAVVAQEVRNLASRSAEAAKEIKDLVENATTKANSGKDIAANMIKGYETLNENIQKTVTIISDVSTASREQQQGIEQINDSVNQLDKQTQEIAAISSTTQNIANQTNTIADEIVKNTDEKEFIGKDTVKSIQIDTKINETKNLNIPSHTKPIEVSPISKPTQINKPRPSEQKVQTSVQNKPITDNSSDDEWESF